MAFHLTRKYLEEQISDSEIALEKHNEGVRVHEIVMAAFKEQLSKLPLEVGDKIKCTSISPSED